LKYIFSYELWRTLDCGVKYLQFWFRL